MSKRMAWSGVLATVGFSCWIVLTSSTGQLLLSAWAQDGKKPAAERAPVVLDRAPLREIADPNPVFSGIAMDSVREEVFITNDNEPSGVSFERSGISSQLSGGSAPRPPRPAPCRAGSARNRAATASSRATSASSEAASAGS